MFSVQFVFLAVLTATSSVVAGPIRSRDASDADISRLAPPLGFSSGINPTGTGDCDGAVNGANGKPIKIPCNCPPSQADFIAQLQANVHAGHAVRNPGVSVSFPTDNSQASQLARLHAGTVTIQNLRGPGVGCPQVSTTFDAQAKAIQNGSAPPPPAAAPPPPAAAPAPPPAQAVTPPPANNGGGDAIARLTPDFGFQSGIHPTGTGDCDGAVNGANGQPIKIPCACPPARADFLNQVRANVAAGHVVNNAGISVSFPTDNSQQSQLARLQTAIVSLQNLRGPGVGCPVVSTTFLAQQDAIRKGTPPPPAVAAPPPAPAPAAPAPAPPANNGGDDIARLAPPLGFTAGVNPTGTGDCDGAVKGANGLPIKIPCSCPPAQDTYIQALRANVKAGHAVNNPSVSVSFPTDDSKASKNARITAAIITLQNLNGPGRGCPSVSTTLTAQQQAL